MNRKQILINQIITDLGNAKITIDEQGFLGMDEINQIIDKINDVKEIEDREVEAIEKDDLDPNGKDWPEAHGETGEEFIK